MRIRPLQKEEVEQALVLSEFAFQYSRSHEERQEAMKRVIPANILGYFNDDDQLAAKVEILPLATWLNGISVPMGGIAGVATWPEFRRQGLVRQLLEQALHTMRDKKQCVSLLHPFSFSFYRKYGWEVLTERKTYTLRTDQIPRFPDNTGYVRRVGENIELLSTIYTAYAKQYNGMLDRDEQWWRNRRLKKKAKREIAVYYDRNDEPLGYMVFTVQDQQMTVEEIVWLDHHVLEGLLHFISNHDSMVKHVQLLVPGNDRLAYFLPDASFEQRVQAYFMARIVDVEQLVQSYRFVATGSPCEWVLHIEDPYAHWNNGSFLLRVDESGNGSLQPFTQNERSEDDRSGTRIVRCSIETLSAIFFGVERATFYAETNRLVADANVIDELESYIPSRQTFLMDFF